MQVTGVAGRCEVSWNPLRSNGGQCLPLSLSPPSISVITICMKGPHSFKSLYKFWKINVLQLASKTGLTTYQSCRFFSIYLVKNSCYIMLTHSASSKCILGGVWNQESVLFQNQFHWKKKNLQTILMTYICINVLQGLHSSAPMYKTGTDKSFTQCTEPQWKKQANIYSKQCSSTHLFKQVAQIFKD